jgi:hypothetical protein
LGKKLKENISKLEEDKNKLKNDKEELEKKTQIKFIRLRD